MDATQRAAACGYACTSRLLLQIFAARHPGPDLLERLADEHLRIETAIERSRGHEVEVVR